MHRPRAIFDARHVDFAKLFEINSMCSCISQILYSDLPDNERASLTSELSLQSAKGRASEATANATIHENFTTAAAAAATTAIAAVVRVRQFVPMYGTIHSGKRLAYRLFAVHT